MVTTSHMLLLVPVLAPLRQRQTGHKTSSNYAASALGRFHTRDHGSAVTCSDQKMEWKWKYANATLRWLQ